MDLLQAFVLAVVQGVTEFLPISSSGMLILVPHFAGWPDQGLAFDVALHVGTLVAVVTYFRGSLVAMARAGFASIVRRRLDAEGRLAWLVVAGTVPVGLAGVAFADAIETHLRSPLFIAFTLAFFGVLMWLSDRLGRQSRDELSLGWRDAVLIGIAQAVSLLPGTSRSGITITAGLALGLTRSAAARFSFLLSIPVTALAGGYEFRKMLEVGADVDWAATVVGMVVSCATAYASIHLLLKFIERVGLMPFMVARLLLAGLIVAVFA